MDAQLREAIEGLNKEANELKTVAAQARDEQKTFGATLGDTQKKLDAINARLDEFEKRAKRPLAGKNAPFIGEGATPEQKAAMRKFLRQGTQNLTPEDRKFLSLSDDTTGGFLASDELVGEIIKDVVLFSPLRDYARIRNTSKRSVKIRKRTQRAAAVWVGGERLTKTETQNPKYGLEEIPNHELYAMADISVQDLEDSDFDLESELRQEYAEQFGVSEGLAFLSGSGAGQPEGLLTASGITADVQGTGGASVLLYQGLVNVSHNLKSGYAKNGRFGFNRKTLGAIRSMVDTTGQPLWQPMQSEAPSTILGSPYVELPDMPDVAANAFPVVFGDFKSAYLIVDRVQMTILRDELTQATEGAVRFIARKRVGGQVINPSAVRKLKISVS